jgi:hypothetical protein
MTRDAGRAAMSLAASRLGRQQTSGAHVARLVSVFEHVAAAKGSRGPHVLKRGTKTHTPHFDHTQKTRR